MSTIGELFQYTTGGDKAFMTFGLMSAIVTGCGMPSFVFLFNDLTSGFGTNPDSIDDLYSSKLL